MKDSDHKAMLNGEGVSYMRRVPTFCAMRSFKLMREQDCNIIERSHSKTYSFSNSFFHLDNKAG